MLRRPPVLVCDRRIDEVLIAALDEKSPAFDRPRHLGENLDPFFVIGGNVEGAVVTKVRPANWQTIAE